MKPSRFSLFSRSLIGVAAITLFGSGALLADTFYWDGSETVLTPEAPGPPVVAAFRTGNWGDALNWSTAAAPNTGSGVPGAADTVFFTATGSGGTAQVINLNGTQSVLGIATASQTTTTTLVGGSGISTLNLGTGGLTHTVGGGLTIGSVTAGQEVNISLQGAQTWTSSASGSGQAAIVVRNGVSIGTGGNQTLTLSGFNTGSQINGVISDGNGVLSLAKTGTSVSVWTINATGTYTGTTTVSNGTLRLYGGLGASSGFSVASGATLAVRTLTSSQLDGLISTNALATGSTLEIDNTSGSLAYAGNLSGGFNLTKAGTNTLTLSGTNTYTGTTAVNGGRLVLAAPSSLASFNTAGATTVASGASLVLTTGAAGFTQANIAQVLANTTFTSGGILELDTTAADFAWAGGLTGGIRLTKSGTNTLVLTGNNDTNGIVSVANGTLVASSLSQIGTGGLYLGSGGNSVRFRYTGNGESTTRALRMDGSTGGAVIDASGRGALVFNTAVTGSNGNKTLTLTGNNTDANTVGAIANYGGTTTVVKNGSSHWVMNGANAYSGSTTVNGGTLTLDYSAGVNVFGSGSLIANNGNIIFKGGALNADTISSFQIGNTNAGANRIILDANGGPGFALTITSLAGSAASQHHDVFDLSSSAGNSVTVTGLGAAIGVHNGVLMGNGATAANARASLLVRDTAGYGFATLSGGTSGTLQKLSSFTTVNPGTATLNSAAANYLIGAGDYTNTVSPAFNTMTFNSAGGVINFELGSGQNFAGGDSGKAILFQGSNNINITGGTNIGGGTALWYHNYIGTGAALNINTSLGTANTLLFGGTGFTNYTGTGLGSSLLIEGGIFRVNTDQSIGNTGVRVTGGSVFELGADINGTAANDFSNQVMTSGNGLVMFLGDSGLSAYTSTPGGTRVADFQASGASQSLTWGATGFLTSNDGTSDGDYTFKLSSTLSNATIEVRNSINLNHRARKVNVDNGSAAVDAVLSGVLSGGIASDLIKSGDGTLRLDANNTYGGVTRVDGGRLILQGTVNSTTAVDVQSSILEITASQRINDLATLRLANAQFITNGHSETVASLSLIGANTIDLGAAASVVRISDPAGSVFGVGSTLTLLNWTGSSLGGGADQFYLGSSAAATAGQLSSIFFQDANVDGVTMAGIVGARQLSTGEIVPIPEPSIALLGVFGLTGLALRRKRKD